MLFKYSALAFCIGILQINALNISQLFHIQQKMNHNDSTAHPPGDQLTPASSELLRAYWFDSVDGLPMLVNQMYYDMSRIGNHIGTYFNDIACAQESGMHWVGIHVRFMSSLPFPQHDAFWSALPSIIYNYNSVSYEESNRLMKSKCSCGGYCWNDGDPWVKHLPLIQSIITSGLHLHLASRDHHGIHILHRGMHFTHDEDMSSHPERVSNHQFIPLFPDVAIHYRCSDNLYGGMGLMSIGTIIERIPPNAKSIYIFTETISRVLGSPLSKIGGAVMALLLDELKAFFPQALVVIKRGGNEFTAWSQLAFANITICSPSTFCLWPAIARTGITYMPATEYIGHNHNTRKDWANLGDNFKWIHNPKLFNNFNRESSVEEVLKIISADIPAKSFIRT